MAWNDVDYQYTLKVPNHVLKRKRTREFSIVFHGNQPTYWKVEYEHAASSFGFLNFALSLEYLQTHEDDNVTAKSVLFDFYLNRTLVNRNSLFDFPFNNETRRFHVFDVEFVNYNDQIENTVHVCVRIDLRRGGIEAARAERNGDAVRLLYGDVGSLPELTANLLSLQDQGRYSDLHISSPEHRVRNDNEVDNENGQNRGFRAHKCILNVRWPTLFSEHKFTEPSTHVATDISSSMLLRILMYMYTGGFLTTLGFWENPINAAEFFKVVSLYKIYHLYEAVRQTAGAVVENAINYEYVKRINLNLRFSRGILKEESVSFPVYVYPFAVDPTHPEISNAHIFLFTIHVELETPAGRWLTYTIQSLTDLEFKVQVELGISLNNELNILINRDSHDIEGYGGETSLPILYLQSREMFGHDPYLGELEIFEGLRFGLTFQNKTPPGVCVWETFPRWEVGIDPIEVFQLHLGEMLKKGYKSDLVVQLQRHNNGNTMQLQHIHRLIFHARFPIWHNVVVPNVSRNDDLPDTPLDDDVDVPQSVVLGLSRESYNFIVSFMYTGKTLFIPHAFRDEITNFGIRSRCLDLRYHVLNMPDDP